MSASAASAWIRFPAVGLPRVLVNVEEIPDPSSCRAEKGFIIHHATKRRFSYGKLVEKAGQMEPPKDVPLKEPKDFKIIGKARRRLDTPEKTNGKAIFGIDVTIPCMFTAVVARPPVFGGKVKSFNSDKARAVPGVKEVIQVESGIAVIADGFWPAQKGREALEIVWDEGPLAGLSTEGMREEYRKLAKTPGTVARKKGDAQGSFSKAAKQIEAWLLVPGVEGRLTMALTGQRRLIRIPTPRGLTYRAYDLANDAAESVDRFDASIDSARATALDTWSVAATSARRASMELPKPLARELRELGYLE